MKCKVKSPEGGFTLVEIIASIVLLGVVISVFLSIFPQMINWSNAAEKELVSSNYSARVAHEIFEGDHPGLSETYDRLLNKPKPCENLIDYNPVRVTEDPTNPHPDVIPGETINGVEYKISMQACINEEEIKDEQDLMRVHFTITNDKNNFKMESFAFYYGGK